MSVIVNLAPDTERRLREKAAQKGQTIEQYLGQLAEESAASPAVGQEPSPARSDKTPEEWVAEWLAWVASHRPGPVIADDSRESIYEGRGE
jgi:hypothetical protein